MMVSGHYTAMLSFLDKEEVTLVDFHSICLRPLNLKYFP